MALGLLLREKSPSSLWSSRADDRAARLNDFSAELRQNPRAKAKSGTAESGLGLWLRKPRCQRTNQISNPHDPRDR